MNTVKNKVISLIKSMTYYSPFHNKMFNEYYLRLNAVRITVLSSPVVIILFCFYPSWVFAGLIISFWIMTRILFKQLKEIEAIEAENMGRMLVESWPIIMSDDIPEDKKKEILEKIK